MGYVIRAMSMLGGVAGALLDALARRVPDVAPIVFDRDRSARWAAMVEAADVYTVSDDASPEMVTRGAATSRTG